MKDKILFISTLLPYPLDNGGKIKTYNTLKMLSEEYDIDLVCYYEDDEELDNIKEVKKIVSNLNIIKSKITTNKNKIYMFKLAFRSIFSFLPVTVMKFYNKEFSDLINKKHLKNKYKKIYVDHLQISINLKKYDKCYSEYVLDQHNCEYLIMKRKYINEKHIIKKVFFLIESFKLQKYEENTLKKFDKIIALSQNDKKEMENIGCENQDISVVPIPFSNSYIKKINEDNTEIIRILFVGTMSWMPNYEGVKWFLENVIPIMKKDNMKFELYIVGKNPPKDILNYDNKKDIKVMGFVEDINEYIELCDCMIVPILFGSGLRVKIIEGFSKNIPIISTSIGAEGLKFQNNENILIADTPNEFLNCIKKMYDINIRKKISGNARKIFEEEYSFDSVKQKILKLLNEGV